MKGYFNTPLKSSQVLITPPSVEPVTLDFFKLWARIDSDITQDDPILCFLLTAARQYCEATLNWALITQTWQFNLDSFPWYWDTNSIVGPSIDLPMPPLQSVTSLCYYDPSNTLQTLDPSDYVVDTNSTPGRIIRQYNIAWPITRWRSDSVEITLVCGFGDSVSDVPSNIIQAICVMALYSYRNRGDETVQLQIPPGVDALLGATSIGVYR